MYDFHTHTFLSDGVLAPIELIRRALAVGYKVMAITDHVGEGNLEFILKILIKDCETASKRWDILVLPGVEITHTPKEDIAPLAKEARKMGARVVNVHGETLVEPVQPGTNWAAVNSPDVDILAHPGLLTLEEANTAAKNGIFLEVSARKGHSLSNGHVVKMAREANANLILDSDAHEPEDLLSHDFAKNIALGAGLSETDTCDLLDRNPKTLLSKIGISDEELKVQC